MHKLFEFFKTLNVLFFRRKHFFKTHYSAKMPQLFSIEDLYTYDRIVSNSSIQNLVNTFMRRYFVRMDLQTLVIEMEGSANLRLKGYTYSAKRDWLRSLKDIDTYTVSIDGKLYDIQICSLFMKKYFLFGSPTYIHFNIVL